LLLPALLSGCAQVGSITFEYPVSLLDDQTEAAMALIADHCGRTYTVTQEVRRFAWHAVDARCDRPQAEPDNLPPCAYEFPDNVDQGQEGEGLP
jgi:hypothetical protein